MYLREIISEFVYFENVDMWIFIAIPFASRAGSLVECIQEWQ